MNRFQGCQHWGWVGDGFCDDIANNVECNYDGGDCCLSDIKTDYCSECLCLEGNSTTTTAGPHEGNITTFTPISTTPGMKICFCDKNVVPNEYGQFVSI